MARVEKTIEVDVPVRAAYDQWTQFEDFPNFMEGVEQVIQMDDKQLHWRAKIGGSEQEWDAVIREQTPDQKIIWRNTSGAENAGMVTFDNLGANRTRVHLEMSYDPEGFVENMGDKLGFVSRRVEGDLKRFKEFIESRGNETGGWRGEIKNPDVRGGHTRGDTAAMESGEGSGQHADMEGSDKPAGWALHESTGGGARMDSAGTGRSGYGPESDPIDAPRQGTLNDAVGIDSDSSMDRDRSWPDAGRRDMP